MGAKWALQRERQRGMEQKGWAWQGQTAKRAKTSRHRCHVLCQSLKKSLFFLCFLKFPGAFRQHRTQLLFPSKQPSSTWAPRRRPETAEPQHQRHPWSDYLGL